MSVWPKSKRIRILQKAVLALAEHQRELQSSLERPQQLILDTQGSLRELGQKTDERIGALVSAVAKLAEQRANGPGWRLGAGATVLPPTSQEQLNPTAR
jgi:hypothetical protein